MTEDFDDAAFDKMLDHCRSRTDVEVGGLLVGDLLEDGIVVHNTIPALEAAAGTANVTFTHEVWDMALAAIEKEYPDQRIIGWYHTHPRFGVFMSDYDKFIQENFFSNPRLVGIVIDPLAGTGGRFRYTDGSVNEVSSFEIAAVADEQVTEAAAVIRKREDRSRWLLVVPAVAIIGLIAGYVLGGGLKSSTSSSTARSAPGLNSAPTTRSPALATPTTGGQNSSGSSSGSTSPTDQTSPCTIGVTVGPGTTYWGLATTLLGSGTLYPYLQLETHGEALLPGEVLNLQLPACHVG